MQCPSCNAELQKSDYQKLSLDMCPNCSGVWLAQDKLEPFIQLHIKYADYLPDVKYSSDRNVGLADGIPQILQPCPQCNKPMKWYSYDLEANVHLYRCMDCHGVWVDSSKINRLVLKVRDHSDYKLIGEEIIKDDKRLQLLLKMARVGKFLNMRPYGHFWV